MTSPRANLLALLAAASVVWSTSTARADARGEAAERFDRGLRLVDDGDLSGGLAEFQRAYDLAPLPVILFNVGLVEAELGRPVDAAKALRQVIAKPEAVAPERLARAKEVLPKELDRIGQVAITASVPEGTVELDNVEVAKWPMADPLEVSSGSHVVGIVTRGYAPARQEVRVAAHERTDVQLDLVPIEGVLAHVALHSHVPHADVLLDGKRVGQTPLDTTIAVVPGAHRIEVRRAGYTSSSRELTLGDGAQGDVTLEPAIDAASLSREGGWLDVESSESQTVMRMDGQDLGVMLGPVLVPAGAHRLHFARTGFIEGDRDVDVPVGATAHVQLVLEPTPDTRVAYAAGASSRRTWSIVTMVVGAAVAGGGAALALVAQSQLPDAQSQLDVQIAQRAPMAVCDPMGPNGLTAACDDPFDAAQSKVDTLHNERTAGWIGAGAGGAVFVTGLVLLLTGDNPHRYDERPSQPVLEGWRFVPSIGLRTASITAAAAF
ncbi:MAG TPA: PEGA domain-containing protein [Polyangiaceae bacterium]